MPKRTMREWMYEDRGGLYVHAIEVESPYELESIIENVVDTYSDKFSKKEIKDFVSTLEVYYLGEDSDEEEEVYNFDFREYIEGIL